jgi:hypothetical protein
MKDQTLLGDFGGISRLWTEAAQWAAEGPGSENAWKSHHFRRWWLRAALARAHGEWLLAERAIASVQGHTKPIEAWRLQLPGHIDQYDNDCGIHALLTVMETNLRGPDEFPMYHDDKYNTEYNIMQMRIRESQSNECGYTLNCFTYGAPVSWRCCLKEELKSDSNIRMPLLRYRHRKVGTVTWSDCFQPTKRALKYLFR